jgi:hypothetical protein
VGALAGVHVEVGNGLPISVTAVMTGGWEGLVRQAIHADVRGFGLAGKRQPGTGGSLGYFGDWELRSPRVVIVISRFRPGRNKQCDRDDLSV